MSDKPKPGGKRRRPPGWFMPAIMTGLAAAALLLAMLLHPLTF